MQSIKFQWKRWLLLLTVLAMTVTLVAGCGPAVEEKPTIKFYDGAWESCWVENAIAKFIIEEGYGYPVETILMNDAIMQVALVKGDVHVNIEMWTANRPEWHKEHIAAGDIEDLAIILEGGPQFFIIPQWVAEEYNIKTVFDMKEHWELFKDPEVPTKGTFVNSIIGWMCTRVNVVKLEAYGLTDYYTIVESGSSGALDAALVGPMKKHKPVFGYYWAPTALMGMYDWYILEEPEYDAEVWEKVIAAAEDPSLQPISEACAYQSLPLPITIWHGLRDMAPDVVAMLEKMVVGLETLNKTAAWAVETEIAGDWEKAAIYYLKTYDERWKTWVTDDAYKKIKDALAEY